MALFNFKKLFSGEVPEIRPELKDLVNILYIAKYPIVITGAGISVKSGIPDFRGPEGLWKKFSPSEFVEKKVHKNPEKFWEMMAETYQKIKNAKPNEAHRALATLEKLGYIKAIITQNIDNLHQKAGSKNVIEFHGSIEKLICTNCGRKFSGKEIKIKKIPLRCPICGGILIPEILFFQGKIRESTLKKVEESLKWTDVLILVGTSVAVEPAAEIPYLVKENGGTIVEINISPTYITGDITDIFIPCDASEALSKLEKTLSNIL